LKEVAFWYMIDTIAALQKQTLGQEISLSGNGLLDYLNLCSNIFLQFHGVGNTIFRGHFI